MTHHVWVEVDPGDEARNVEWRCRGCGTRLRSDRRPALYSGFVVTYRMNYAATTDTLEDCEDQGKVMAVQGVIES
jgi:hypothetical protein